MSFHGFLQRYKHLALWLSLVAVCAALLAPASALAQELREGQWIGLCSAGQASGSGGHGDAEGSHCDLCVLPGLALELPGSSAFDCHQAEATLAVVQAPSVAALAGGPPAIRGPPDMS
jgi:hypothetical protein